jgi:hypothetical protein
VAVYSKRKNDDPRPFPWWLLVVGFGLGVLMTIIVLQGRIQPPVSRTANMPEGLELTATSIIEQATQQAFATPGG